MSGNRAVAYKGPGVVEVIDTDYPKFELKDGPGVNPANVGRKVPHGAILKVAPPTSVAAISTWSVAAQPLRLG